MNRWIMVALGGAAGAAGRYGISLIPLKTEFPLLTLFTNLAGALLIGFIAGISTQRKVNDNWILFWKTGVCGGFTTFSTFSLEAWSLLQKEKFCMGGFYILLSVLLCISGVVIGQYAGARITRG